jgi:hypothetical protein
MPITIRPGAEIDDVSNLLQPLVQLEAMLMATREAGKASAAATTYCKTISWSCMDVATDCRALFNALSVAMNEKGGAA